MGARGRPQISKGPAKSLPTNVSGALKNWFRIKMRHKYLWGICGEFVGNLEAASCTGKMRMVDACAGKIRMGDACGWHDTFSGSLFEARGGNVSTK